MKTNLLPAGLRLLCAALFSTLSLAHADDAAWRKQLLGTWKGAVVSDEETGARRATIRELTITMDKISATDGDGRCSANGGKPRPTEFKTRSSGPRLMILTRKRDRGFKTPLTAP
jgi:hypothetical protein